MKRVAVFNIVGAIGFGLQVGLLSALTRGVGLPPVAATIIAVETTILHNFVWHERWTWRERRDPRLARRLLRFNLVAGVTLLANVAITSALATRAGWPIEIANLVAVGVCGLFTYLVSDRLVFAAPGRPPARAFAPSPREP